MGEKLANLAGYSLRNLKKRESISESEKKVSFSDICSVKIFEKNQWGKGKENFLKTIREDQSPVYRVLSEEYEQHPFTSAMAQLDDKMLPDVCKVESNATKCNCKKCRDGMCWTPACVVKDCSKCILARKESWK